MLVCAVLITSNALQILTLSVSWISRIGTEMSDPVRVVVEIATPEVVSQLKAENEALRARIDILTKQHNSLHETVYRLMDRFGELRRSLKENGSS